MLPIIQSGTEPFWLAIMVMVGLCLIELCSHLMGGSVAGLIDEGLAADGPPDTDPGLLGSWMSWLNAGRVPLLVLAVLILCAFAVFGLAIQAALATIAAPLPATVASLIALGAAIPTTRWFSKAVAKIIPRDETTAISQADYIGLTGEVSVGPLDQDAPGIVRVKDMHDNYHNVRTRAAPGHTISVGSKVLIVDGRNGEYEAIPAPDALA